LGATERLSGDHEQRFLLISSAIILQNPSVTISIIRQLKGKEATNHERLRITVLVYDYKTRDGNQKHIVSLLSSKEKVYW